MSADFLDVATDLALEFNKVATEAVRSRVPTERECEDDAENACDCGEIIPSARWAKGYDNCVSCARYEEQLSGRYRRTRLED